jgi:hypothetical protein
MWYASRFTAAQFGTGPVGHPAPGNAPCRQPIRPVLPTLPGPIVAASDTDISRRFEFFIAKIRNKNTRAAYEHSERYVRFPVCARRRV